MRRGLPDREPGPQHPGMPMRGDHEGRAAEPGSGRASLRFGLLLTASLIAPPVAAEESALGWQDIEALLTGGAGGAGSAPPVAAAAGPMSWGDIAQILTQSGVGEAPAAGPSLAEQLQGLSEGLRRWSGSADATGAIPFADLRTGDKFLTARHPLLSSGYESGTGAVSQPIAIGEGLPLTLELGHVAHSNLTLAANETQLGAQIEDRSFTQIAAGLKAPAESSLSLVLGRSVIVRRQTAGYAPSDPYGSYSYGGYYGSYGASAQAGDTDASGLALDLSLFSGKAVLKAGYARSVFTAPESGLTALGFDDPLAELLNEPEEGDSRYIDLSLTPWQGPDGLLQLKVKQSQSDEAFEGSGGWDYASAGSQRSIAAEGRWRGLSLRADRREKEDEVYNLLTDQSSASASLYLDWLDLSLSRSFYESTSEYTYLSYVYGQDPEDYFAGMWVPLKISNTRSTDTASGNARLHGEAWSVDLDWSRSDGTYRYGDYSESGQSSQDWIASASYDFGVIGLQASFSRSDEIYGVEPDPVVSARAEGGLTLSFDFDQSGHHYDGPSSTGYYYGGPYGAPYGGAYGGGYGRYDPSSEFPWLAPGAVPLPGALSGYGFPQPGSVGHPLGPAGGGASKESSFLSQLLPSTARIGLRQGVATEESGDDGLGGLPPAFSNSLSAPLGPYYALEGGLGWNGEASSTDLSFRLTLASGDAERYAAGGISYEAELSERIQLGPLALGASIEGTLSRFDQPSEVETEIYASATAYASYSIDWLSFDAQAYGAHQQTRYADGSDPYASDYANLQLGAQVTLDRMLPAAWLRAEAPPYLRLRGYYDFGYSASAYETLAAGSAGVILFGGMRF